MAAETNHVQSIDINTTKAMFNVKTFRIVSITISIMLIVLALVMVVVGNMAYWYSLDYTFFLENSDMKRHLTPLGLCSFIGAVLVFVATFGFYGSYRKSTCMVNSYAALLLCLLILKVVTVCLAYTLDVHGMWQRFDIPVSGMHNPVIQAEVDYIQSSLGCCGNSYYTDYAGVEYPSNMSTVGVVLVSSPSIQDLPASCCINSYDDGFCSHIWPNGCKPVLINSLHHNAITVGVLGISAMMLNLLAIFFAVLLARCIRTMKSEKVLLSWKMKEQIIFARQDEEMGKNEQVIQVRHLPADMV